MTYACLCRVSPHHEPGCPKNYIKKDKRLSLADQLRALEHKFRREEKIGA